MKKKWSIRVYFLVQMLLCAALMTVQGIAEMFGSSRGMHFLQGAICIGFIVLILVRSRAEPLDEMARRKLGKAAYGTILFILIVLICISAFLDFWNHPVILHPTHICFFMSAVFLSLGILFFAFDKWGKT